MNCTESDLGLTGNLDPTAVEEVFTFLLDLLGERRPTTLLVTHNPGLAERYMLSVRMATNSQGAASSLKIHPSWTGTISE